MMSQMITAEARVGTISGACEALGLVRATYYRYRNTPPPVDADIELRNAIQLIALAFPAYGYRRITAQLKRDGWVVNHKRVLRLMREDNLLCLRKKRFVSTTDSNHALGIYPNLVPDLVLTDTDQLWVADLTYLRLPKEFIYLAVVLDVFSRRCIGWALGRQLDASLTVAALQQALASRHLTPQLVHHSDRGVQYASQAYTRLLKQHQIQISMSRKANPYDNAYAESFIKTLKYEEVHLNDYDSLSEARAAIGTFINDLYNQQRLHSALGYLPPIEFERTLSIPHLP
jgi:putative transposase